MRCGGESYPYLDGIPKIYYTFFTYQALLFMLTIRLTRVGTRNAPAFRVVVQEKHRAPVSKSIEILGNYTPRLKFVKLNAERIQYWISKGAQPSETLHNLFVSQGIITDKKVGKSSITKKRTVKIAKAKAEEAKKAEAVAA